MFNALCENGKAEAANYPFCTIEPNVGIVAVPDERLQARLLGESLATHFAVGKSAGLRDDMLQVLSSISSSQKIIPTTIEYVDIAGLVKGASTGEGLGNKFLSNIRECDSIVQVWLTRTL